MALVITVILLAVVTLMAITFLAVSRRERSSVTTSTDATTAQLAADNALAAAEAQIMATTFAATNPYNFGLVVSTNFINRAGFDPKAGGSPTNVNYDYYTTKPGPLSAADFLQNLANLYYLPRPPVYATNYIYRSTGLQFYLDLNRNGLDEPNGFVDDTNSAGFATGLVISNAVGDPEWIGILQHPDQPYGPNNPFVARYAFIAVPVGNTLDLNSIHNDSAGIGGKQSMAVYNGFFRNQGVGSWEVNLAAFLADLNTNEWGQIVGSGAFPPPGSASWYQYNEGAVGPSGQNRGVAFEDAQSLLSYRYAGTYLSLDPVGGGNGLFTRFPNFPPFQNNIDYYSQGPLMTGPGGVYVSGQNVKFSWSGSDNPNHFFDLQELYNPSESSQLFTNRLNFADKGVSTYNRYTYYRLLSQLGVDSAPAQNQMNLNYSNAVAYYARDRFNRIIPGVVTNIVFFPNAETNFAPWDPLQFFTIAADRMLRAYSQEWMAENPSNYIVTYGSYANISTTTEATNVPIPFGISDIPVWVSNRFVYTPAVQRVLQLAANMYDATTNQTARFGADYPSVFRPIFLVTNDFASGYTNVYIRGFEPVGQVINGVEQVGSVQGTNDFQLNQPVDVTSLSAGSATLGAWQLYTNVNVYGVPWIIGAKKGFPSFNEFSMVTLVGVTRKLEVTRPSLNATLDQYETNQMYLFSISNSLGVECWNSYAPNYVPSTLPNGLTIVAGDNFSITLSNRDGLGGVGSVPHYYGYQVPSNNPSIFPFGNAVYINSLTGSKYWPGTTNTLRAGAWPASGTPYSASFDIPLLADVFVLTNSIYEYRGDNPAYNWGAQPDTFIPASQNTTQNYDYPDLGTPPLPQFDLVITNRVQVYMLDGNHVIDYVQLGGPDTVTNLNRILADAPNAVSRENANMGIWNTNSLSGLSNGTPFGVVNQILYSLNPWQNPNPLVAGDNGTWRDPQGGGNKGQAAAAFQAFFSPNHKATVTDPDTGKSYSDTNLNNFAQAGFTPTRNIYGYTSWQANDPQVHYLVSDLNFIGAQPGGLETGWHQWDNVANTTPATNLPPTNLGKLNDRYMPWGGNPAKPGKDPNPHSLALKDPLVRSSDNWDFPADKLPTVGWLGRVHRGTPWQTVYLKSANVLQRIQVVNGVTNYVGTNVWAQWTGDSRLTYGQEYDAVNSAPVQDRLLFDLFSTAPNDNATRGQLSVNVGASDIGNPQAGLAAWSALFSGVQVLSNNVGTSFVPRAPNPIPGELPPAFTNGIVDPAGTTGANSALGKLVTSINQTRANFVNLDGIRGAFEHAGDILAVPQLSDASPFLNSGDPAQQQNGISDELYEWLPQQVMSLLRTSGTPQSPGRYIIYSYGQALKPAPNGINTGNTTLANGQSAFGMVTNYQVVAAYATRSVVNFGSVVTNIAGLTNDESGNQILFSVPVVTNNTVQIQQFNVLPPY